MPKKQVSYDDAIIEIETIMTEVENGGLNVDDLTGKVKQVAKLIKLCKEKLRLTELEVEKILNEMTD